MDCNWPTLRSQFVLLAVTFVTLVGTVLAQEGDVVGVHDPCVIKDGNTFVLFSTGGLLSMRRSQDLLTWQTAGDTLPELPGWAKEAVPDANGCWAPDISCFNGTFHLYYSVSTFGSNRSCIGLATNVTLDTSSPKYKWIDQGMVIRSRPDQDNFNAIDPNVVLDEKGQPWLSFGSFWSGIKMSRLDLTTGKPVGNLLDVAGRNGGAIEAPFIVRHGRSFYLFVSFDTCCKGADSTYKIMVGRSQRVSGPFLDYSGKKMLNGGGTLVLASYKNVRGPGHNAVLSDGGKDYLVHHFYDADRDGRPTLQIRPLLWGRDGWPLAGEPIAPANGAQEQRPDLTGTWEHSVDFGDSNPITLLGGGKINEADSKATWRLTGSTLELRWPRSDGPRGVWIDRCVVSPAGDWYVGRNQRGMVIRGVRVH